MVAFPHRPDSLTRLFRIDDATMSVELAKHVLSVDFTDEERAALKAHRQPAVPRNL
jgi:hypothetical protein